MSELCLAKGQAGASRQEKGQADATRIIVNRSVSSETKRDPETKREREIRMEETERT